jgi:hypothetical protein
MKRQLKNTVLALCLVTLLTPAFCFAAAPTGAGSGTPPQNTPPNATGQEKHPVMRKAVNQLQRIKEELQNDASRDFDGHRANAVKLIDQAIEQLQQGIRSDKH